jgi:hypothetical protein
MAGSDLKGPDPQHCWQNGIDANISFVGIVALLTIPSFATPQINTQQYSINHIRSSLLYRP